MNTTIRDTIGAEIEAAWPAHGAPEVDRSAGASPLGPVFVFPSEIAAAFWTHYTVRRSGYAVVPSNRFIAWDRFKEAVSERRHGSLPANNLVRTLFAAGFLTANRRNPVVKHLINPDYAENSPAFLPSVVRVLPTLPALIDAGCAAAAASGLFDDYRVIYEQYRRFLDEHALFEPNWITEEFKAGSERYVVFLPELIADFQQYEPRIREAAEWVRVVPTPFSADVPTLTVYESTTQELSLVLAQIEDLLDAGVPAHDIVISAADLDAVADALRSMARIREVPVRIRRAAVLADYAPARLFRLLYSLGRNQRPHNELARLVLDYAIPWKRRSVYARLVDFGAQHGIVNNLVGLRSSAGDLWERTLRACGERDLAAAYAEIGRLVVELRNARGFDAVRQALHALLNGAIDAVGWSETDESALQRCLDELSELSKLEARVGLPVSDPMAMWLQTLEDRLYLPRQEGQAVEVVQYRVAAGTMPAHHFLVNVSQRTTRAVADPFAFLPESARSALPIPPRDMSESFFRAYAGSGARVYFSGAERSLQGVEVAPSMFLAADRTQRFDGHDGHDSPVCGRQRLHPAAERGFWRRSGVLWSGDTDRSVADGSSATGPLPVTGTVPAVTAVPVADGMLVYPLLQQGLARILPGIRPAPGTVVHCDMRTAPLRNPRAAMGYLTKGQPSLTISASGLNRFLTCPLQFFFHTVCGIPSDRVFAPQSADPRTLGIVIHAVLERVLADITAIDGGVLAREHLDAYRRAVDSAIDSLFGNGRPSEAPAELLRTARMFLPALVTAREPFRAAVAQCVADLADHFGGHRVLAPEAWETAWQTVYRSPPDRGVGPAATVPPSPDPHAAQDLAAAPGVAEGGGAASGVAAGVDPPPGCDGMPPVEVRLNGRIDFHAATNPGRPGSRPVLVDFKSGEVPAKKNVGGPGVDPTTVTNFQLPFYSRLVRAEAPEQCLTFYYSLKKSALVPFYPGDERYGVDDNGFAALQEALHLSISAVVTRVIAGDFRPPDDQPACSDCALRAVCRTRFFVR